MQRVAELTSVPVPQMYWSETDETAIGSPFFVMGRVDGEVPPDVMPYNFGDSWLYHAPREDQSRLQESTVGVLAALHDIPDAPGVFSFLEFPGPGRTALRRHVNDQLSYYEWAVSGTWRSPLIDP